jgi:dienelactone hydrolase
MRKLIIAFCMLLAMAAAAEADVTGNPVEYEHDGTICEGWLALDESISATRPGVFVIHQWMGLTDFEKQYCERLAAQGYVVLAADVYGRGVRPADRVAAGEQATLYRSDRALMRSRLQAGLEFLRSQVQVDGTRIAAMGFCFGGGCALELARSGADVEAVVSFHGNLDTPNPADAANITGSVLVLHGADDPFVSPESLQAFQEEMRSSNVDWQLVSYGNAVHAFTHEDAGSDNSTGAAYNEKAAMRSWQAMLDFLQEVLK